MEAKSPPCFSQSYLRTQETGTRLTQNNHHAPLHSIRKQPAKPWKKPQATHPRIYRVEPVNFKELVQRLTGSPEPPPSRPAAAIITESSAGPKPLLEALHTESKPLKIPDEAAKESFLGFDLSPSSSRFWDAFPLLSPANLTRW